MSQYYDFLYKLPLGSLALGITGFTALQAAGLIAPGDIPANMLGDPRDANGNIVTSAPAFVGRQGTAATSYTDANGNTVAVPARGDPAYWYIAIRAAVDPATLPVDPASFGLIVCDAAENAAVLGVWA